MKTPKILFLPLILLIAFCTSSLEKKLDGTEKMLSQEKYQDALSYLEGITEYQDQIIRYDLLKAKLLFYTGFITKASQYLDLVMESLNKEKEGFPKELIKGDIYYYSGLINYKILKYNDAAGWYKKALQKVNDLENSKEFPKRDSEEKNRLQEIKVNAVKGLIFVLKDRNESDTMDQYIKTLQSLLPSAGIYSALSYASAGDHLKAIEIFDKSKDYWNNISSMEKISLQIVYNQCLKKKWDYEGAEKILTNLLVIGEEKGMPIEKKNILLELGFFYQETGDYVKSSTRIKEAFEVLEEISQNEKFQKSFVYGMFYYHNKEFQKSEELFVPLVSIKDCPVQYRMIANNYLGIMHLEKNKYYEAIHFFLDALKLSEPDKTPLIAATIYNNLGIAYINLNTEDKAKKYLYLSIKTIEEEMKKNQDRKNVLKEMLVLRLINIAGLYLKKNSFQRAFDYLEKIKASQIEDNRELSAFYQVLFAKTLVAETAFRKEEAKSLESKYYKAIESFKSSLRFFAETNNFGKTGEILFHLGKINFYLGNDKEALEYFRESLSHYKNAADKKGEALAGYGASLLLGKKEKYEEAVGYLKDSVLILDEIETQFNFQELSSEFFSKNYGAYELLVEYLLRLKSYEEAFSYYEKIKSRSFLKMVYQGMMDIEKEIPLELKNEINRIYGQNSFLNQKIQELYDWNFNPVSRKIRENYIEQIKSNDKRLKELRVEINLKAPNFKSVRYPEPVTVKEIQGILSEGELLLSYYLSPKDKVYIFAVTSNTFQVIETLDFYNLKKMITKFRKNLKVFSEDTFILNHLYETLFEKIHPEALKYNRIIIIPDTSLYYLPFEALVYKKKKQNKYLLEESFVISYSHSAGILKLLRQKQKNTPPKSIFSIGDAFLGRYSTLPFTKIEMQEIHNIMGGEVYTGIDATETRVKAARLSQYQYIHFSTHGFFDASDFSKQAILLTKDSKNDGWLTLEEIYSLKLNSELVTLSACNTGMGKENKQEGLFGLAQSFFYAGTSSLIASLWPVLDNTTAETMIDLYRNIKKKQSAPQALKKAKIKVLHKWKRLYAWAPFIYFGK